MVYESELYHHGILGMLWGRKNGPPYPLGSSDHSASEKKAGWRKSLDDSKSSNNKSKSSNSKSSETDSEKAEKRKKIIKKALIITGAVAATAAIAYVAHNKYCKEYVDDVIKSGTKLQTITSDKNKELGERFYAAYKGSDKVIYKGLYGNQIANGLYGGSKEVYNMTTETLKDLKVPSREKAASVFADLYKSDSSFKNEVNNVLGRGGTGMMGKQYTLFENAKSIVNSGSSDRKSLMKDVYNAFNSSLVGDYANENVSKASKTFYDKLKSMGYSAIVDMNDSKYSGFKSNKPVIVFDTKSVTKTVVDKVTDKELKVNNIGQNLIRNGSTYAATAGIAVGANKVKQKTLQTRIPSLKSQGYTNQEIAYILGISTSTVSKYLS